MVSPFSVDCFGLTELTICAGNLFNLPEKFGYRKFLCLRTENHVLQSKFFVSQYAKKPWEPLLSFRRFGILETFTQFTVFLLFFVSQYEKLLEEPSNISESFDSEVSKNFMNKNGISLFSVGNFLAQSAKKFRCGTLRYMRKVRLSKKFKPMRLISLFSVEFFSRILSIKFVVEPLCVSESLGLRKLLCSVRSIAIFRWFFGLPVLKNFVGNPFSLTGNFGHRNFLCMRTENHVFLPKFLCLTIPKKFVVTTSKFQMIWDRENFL